LRDIGDASLGLLGPVLLKLDPKELTSLEEATLAGASRRDVTPDTWYVVVTSTQPDARSRPDALTRATRCGICRPLWYLHCTKLLNESIHLKKELKMSVTRANVNADSPLLPLVASTLGKSALTIKHADYRDAFAKLAARKREILAVAGEALRASFKNEAGRRQERKIVVIDDPLSVAARSRKGVGRGARGGQGRTFLSNAAGTKPAVLARKLGIAKPAMPSKTARAATTTKVTRTVNAKLERESIIRRINNSNQSARFKKSILPTQKQLAGPRK